MLRRVKTAPIIPQHLKFALIFKLVPDTSFASVEVISAFVDMDLMMMKKMMEKSNADT